MKGNCRSVFFIFKHTPGRRRYRRPGSLAVPAEFCIGKSVVLKLIFVPPAVLLRVHTVFTRRKHPARQRTAKRYTVFRCIEKRVLTGNDIIVFIKLPDTANLNNLFFIKYPEFKFFTIAIDNIIFKFLALKTVRIHAGNK